VSQEVGQLVRAYVIFVQCSCGFEYIRPVMRTSHLDGPRQVREESTHVRPFKRRKRVICSYERVKERSRWVVGGHVFAYGRMDDSARHRTSRTCEQYWDFEHICQLPRVVIANPPRVIEWEQLWEL